MSEVVLTQNNFSGGIADVSEKLGKENSAKFIKNSNIFEDPSYFIPALGLTKVSSTTIDGLPHWMVDGSPYTTDRYVYDSGGKLYKCNSSDTVSSLRTVSGGGGEGLLVYDNRLLYAQPTELGSYYPLDNSPAFQDSFSGWWIASQLTDTGGGTGATDYVPPTSISEAATAQQTFTATYDPIYSVTIDVDVVGTGDWTVTVHNTNDDVIGTSTITNGNMSTGDVEFVLSSVGRIKKGETYHFHVTSTVADGGVDTSTNTDLEAAEYTITYGTLISSTFHPMVDFLNLACIGNERYLATFDGATYNPNRIVLPPGFEIRAIAKFDEFIVMGAIKGQSMQENEKAKLYFWDGIESTFIDYRDVTVGVVNALANYQNNLVGVYGIRGSVKAGTRPFEDVIDELPKLPRDHYLEIYPGAITTYGDKLLIGAAGVTDDGSDFEQGVYEFGSQSDELVDALNFPYTISTGTTQSTTVKIGMVQAFGQDLYVGWRDGASYGLDKATVGDNAAASGSWESRIFDDGDPNEDMQAVKVEITFAPLVSGESITPKYQLDRAGSFTTGDTENTVGATKAQVFINTRCREVEWGFNWASSSGTFPKVTAVKFVYDNLEDERES